MIKKLVGNCLVYVTYFFLHTNARNCVIQIYDLNNIIKNRVFVYNTCAYYTIISSRHVLFLVCICIYMCINMKRVKYIKRVSRFRKTRVR